MVLLRHTAAILALPVMVTLVIPALLVSGQPLDHFLWSASLPLSILLLVGAICLAAGIILLTSTISLFFRVGQGTLAPWDPPTRLVVRGIYRYVRNPMISGVIAVLLGESLLLGSPAVAAYLFIVIVLNCIYIPLIEEPELEKRFGEAYVWYKRNVPRWIPLRKPWDAPD